MASSAERDDLPLYVKGLAVAAVPCLLLLDTGLALARGWHTTSRLDLAAACLPALVVLALLVATALPAGRSLLTKSWAAIAFIVLSCTAAWLAAEAAVAAYVSRYPLEPAFHQRAPNSATVFRPLPGVMPGINGESRFTTNSLGVRGPELPDRDAAYRILCIGGSTTECLFLDDEETWPHLLMEELNAGSERRKVWVGNVGVSGNTTIAHLRFAEEAELMQEIDCLVLLIGANDCMKWLRGKLEALEAARAQAHRNSLGPLWARSCILHLFRVFWHRRTPRRSLEIEDAAGANYRIRRRERQQAAESAALPDATQPLRQYAERIKALVEVSRQKGVRIVFVTQPTMWREGLSDEAQALLWLGVMRDGKYVSVESGRTAIDQFNDALAAACDTMSVECIDSGLMNGREDLYYDDFHFNEAGARALASLIAQNFHRLPNDADSRHPGSRQP